MIIQTRSIVFLIFLIERKLESGEKEKKNSFMTRYGNLMLIGAIV